MRRNGLLLLDDLRLAEIGHLPLLSGALEPVQLLDLALRAQRVALPEGLVVVAVGLQLGQLQVLGQELQWGPEVRHPMAIDTDKGENLKP